ncbi:putative S-adenosylmethionine-dependent methyltransferase/MSMEI_2290 [Roseimaritima multifibrata]|uniref:Putative S-adenosylmethionine-dependent methyltransferase/MSMEI_2290 n=1 Tax=Roseimaritima multifibrata TaxID=1930274 RepID=A0A517MN98_9BACT|nr:class I SAM-dependent methyltransferase [Roseimaritima multifibrata]QDS96350.1 putative S-adenosylmethionine-dependent methyltransferase/MSMEI_2290 [Roseimaritima multifibrata]
MSNPVGHRGERLYPSRSHRLYWHLTCLRLLYERFALNHVDQGSGDLIDFGCGNMPYRPIFEPHVKKYRGFDLAGNDLADGLIDELGRMQVEAKSVDYVLSSQVLEHVIDPVSYLAEAKRVLKPGGKLFLSTHGVWKYHPDPTDYWRWTCDGLRKVVSEAGYEILDFEGMMGPASTALQLWQDATITSVPAKLRKAFLWSMQRRIERADKKCSKEWRDKDACVYVLVASSV